MLKDLLFETYRALYKYFLNYDICTIIDYNLLLFFFGGGCVCGSFGLFCPILNPIAANCSAWMPVPWLTLSVALLVFGSTASSFSGNSPRSPGAWYLKRCTMRTSIKLIHQNNLRTLIFSNKTNPYSRSHVQKLCSTRSYEAQLNEKVLTRARSGLWYSWSVRCGFPVHDDESLRQMVRPPSIFPTWKPAADLTDRSDRTSRLNFFPQTHSI